MIAPPERSGLIVVYDQPMVHRDYGFRGRRSDRRRIFTVMPGPTASISPCAVERYVGEARRCHEVMETRPAGRQRVADALTADADVLAHLLSREQGKPSAKSQAGVGGAGFFIRGFADLDLAPTVHRDADAQHVRAERRPIGVVGAITAWNYPVLLGAWTIVPAVLTGNAVILKPAPTTQLATLRKAEIADRIFPPGMVTVLAGDDNPAMAGSRFGLDQPAPLHGTRDHVRRHQAVRHRR